MMNQIVSRAKEWAKIRHEVGSYKWPGLASVQEQGLRIYLMLSKHDILTRKK